MDCGGGLPNSGDIGRLVQKVDGTGALNCDWAGDVDCSGGLPNSGDLGRLVQKVDGTGALNCCKGCECGW